MFQVVRQKLGFILQKEKAKPPQQSENAYRRPASHVQKDTLSQAGHYVYLPPRKLEP